MDGQAKGDGMDSAVRWTDEDTHNDAQRLEVELRMQLRDVDLICEADPPVDVLQAAEDECRRQFHTMRAVTQMTERSPATLATYIALRGAERYEGISLWPQLGVTEIPSSHVGQAFLAALRRMGLPDFQEMVRNEGARTYVSPILIHGGIPAEHAHRLVERLEVELRRGLSDGPEAVRRLTAFPDNLGRPTKRLLQYAPEFSGALLDALIDRITGDATTPHRGIPRHVRDALEAGDQARRRGLRRLRVPYVELDDWAGYGPTVVTPENASGWTVDHGDASFMLHPGESAEIDPCSWLSVQSGGQTRLLWNRPVVWFTDTGRLLAPDTPLPGIATALFPRGWEVRDSDGRQPPVVREGAGLSGAWSRHHAVTFDLDGVERVDATPPADDPTTTTLSWPVADEREMALVGDRCTGVSTCDGAPVFSAAPRLVVPSTGGDPALWFRSAGAPARHRVAAARNASADGIDLAEWLGPGVLNGHLDVREADGNRRDWQLAVVPGLAVTGLDRPFGPDATGTATVRARSSSGEVSATVTVPPKVDSIASTLAVDGTSIDLQIDVPRVRWGLRSGKPSRLDLAPGVISAEYDELCADDVWLLIRCGRPATVALELHIDGRLAQVGRDNETRATGGRHHQCAFPLALYGDTLRRHRDAAIELVCRVDDDPLLAVVSGVVPTGTSRPWGSREPLAPAAVPHDPWAEARPIRGRATRSALRELASTDAQELAERILAKLRTASPGDQLVTFLRLLGDSSRRWQAASAEISRSREYQEWGPGGSTWAAYEAVADELWGVQGLRYRRFAGKPLDDGLRRWVGDTRVELRNVDRSSRERIEQWSFGRLPPFGRIERGWFADWVKMCLPPSGRGRGMSGVDLLPASLLYHLLAMAGDDPDAGGPVAAAVDVAPSMVLELTALVLEAARRGRRFDRPRLRPPEEPDTAGVAPAGEAPSGDTSTRDPLRTLAGCHVDVSDTQLRLTPPRPVEPVVLRLWQDGPMARAVAALFPAIDGDDHVCDLPPGLSGRLHLTVADPRSVAVHQAESVAVDVDGRPSQPAVGRAVRGSVLADVEAMRRRALVTCVSDAIERHDLGGAPIEELFEDESIAAEALLDYSATATSTARLDRIGIAVLPTALLFSHLPLAPRAAHELRQRSRALWAALGPRVPSLWRDVGWPNGSRFATGSVAYDDVVVFARKQSALTRDRPVELPTLRYATPRNVVADDRVRETIRRLDRHEVERTFVDLVVAAYCAISIDAVSTEATRLLLTTHDRLPDTTVRAVLVGTALHLASTGIN